MLIPCLPDLSNYTLLCAWEQCSNALCVSQTASPEVCTVYTHSTDMGSVHEEGKLGFYDDLVWE